MYLEISMSLHYPGFSINVDISDHYESLMEIIHHYDPVPINPNKNYWGVFDRGTARYILHRLSKADRMDTRLAQISDKMRLIIPDFNLTGSLNTKTPLTITMTKRIPHGITHFDT